MPTVVSLRAETRSAPPAATAPRPPLRIARRLKRAVLIVLPALIVFGGWALLAAASVIPQTVLIPPLDVLRTILDMARSGELAEHLGRSASRVLGGYSIGAPLGLAVGLGFGLLPRMRAYGELLFHAMRQVPAFAWAPLLILIFGIGEVFKIAVIALAVFFPVALATHEGIREIPARYADVARLYRLTRAQELRRLVLPAAVPAMVTGLRLALSRAWMMLVGVELLGASSGIGWMMDWGRSLFQLDLVMAGIVLTGLVGLLLDRGLRAAEARLLRWHPAR